MQRSPWLCMGSCELIPYHVEGSSNTLDWGRLLDVFCFCLEMLCNCLSSAVAMCVGCHDGLVSLLAASLQHSPVKHSREVWKGHSLHRLFSELVGPLVLPAGPIVRRKCSPSPWAGALEQAREWVWAGSSHFLFSIGPRGCTAG